MTTWVLLRGLMREQRHWEAFPAQLAQALPGCAIVTPDLAGNGDQHRLRSASRVPDMVEFCRAQLRARGHAPPYRLLALSLGGMAAVEWSARHPDEIEGAVLVNSSMRPFSRFHRRLRWQNYGAILKLALLGGIERQERLILGLTSRDALARPGMLERWIGYQREYPVARANALRQLLAAARYTAPAQRPVARLLVLASENDRLVDVGCSLELARRWRAECRLHPGAGHDLPLDDGAWVARQVAEWS